MPRRGSSSGASAPTKTKAAKPKSKTTKPHGKDETSFDVIAKSNKVQDPPDVAVSTSSLQRRSPSSSPDHFENPRSIRRGLNTEYKSAINNPDTGTTAGGADGVHGNVDAKESLPPKNLTLAKGKRRAEVTNTANHANEASARKHSASHKKNYLLLDWLDSQSIVSVLTLSAEFLSTLQGIPREGHGSLLFLEQLMGPPPLAGGHTSMGAYERHLIKGVHLFIEATRSVLLAPHQIPLQEFTRLRKKSETKGGLHPV
ncbi:ABC Superfamily [Phytophthora palmivora]|uniref:ABC Superfamily n=1 Tax=Phytophthora palmivora TaxID=4796 RepID=A0A2P4Y830_9STRA|nr:ABC Superfamily [Phytophthora palmivora]